MDSFEFQRKIAPLRDTVRAINAQIISFQLFRRESPRLDILVQNVSEILANHKLQRNNFTCDEFAPLALTLGPETPSQFSSQGQENDGPGNTSCEVELIENYERAVQEINLQILAFEIFAKDCTSLELFIRILQSIIAKTQPSSRIALGIGLGIRTSSSRLRSEQVKRTSDIGINTERLNELFNIQNRTSPASTSSGNGAPSSTLLSPPPASMSMSMSMSMSTSVEASGPGPGPGSGQVLGHGQSPGNGQRASRSDARTPEMFHGVYHTSVVEPSEALAPFVLIPEPETSEADHNANSNANSNDNDNDDETDNDNASRVPENSNPSTSSNPQPSHSNSNLNSNSNKNHHHHDDDLEEDLPLKKRKKSVTSQLDSSTSSLPLEITRETTTTSIAPSVVNNGNQHSCQQSTSSLPTSTPLVKQESDAESLASRRRKLAFNLPVETKPHLPFRESLQQIESTIEELLSSSIGGATSSSSVTSKDFIKIYCQSIHIGSYKVDADIFRPKETREQFLWCQKMLTVYMCDHGVMFSVPHQSTKELAKLIIPYDSVLTVIGETHHNPLFAIYIRTGNKMARWIREKLGMARDINQCQKVIQRGKSTDPSCFGTFDPYSENVSEKSIVLIVRHVANEQKDAMKRIFGEKLQIEMY